MCVTFIYRATLAKLDATFQSFPELFTIRLDRLMCLLFSEVSTPDEPCCFTFLKSYCWWKKSQTTTWDVQNPVNNGINYQPQLVFSPDFWTINRIFHCDMNMASPQPADWNAKEVRLIEKAVETLGISKAAVRTNAGTKTAVVTHLSKVKPDRHPASERFVRKNHWDKLNPG